MRVCWLYSLDHHKVPIAFLDPEDREVYVECERLEVAGIFLQPLDLKRIYQGEDNLQLQEGTKSSRLFKILELVRLVISSRCDFRLLERLASNLQIALVKRAA